MKKLTVYLILLNLTFCFVAVDLAHAYLDPGAGSMLLQLLLAGLAGLGVLLKLYWRRFLSLFSNDRKRDENK